MPGFVKTPKDEARWAKAKEAAAKETEHGSEGFWKLSNYIYHKMGKTEADHKMAELYKNEITRTFESGKELNIENIRHFLVNGIPQKQPLKGNEVIDMSDGKKYSAKEAALAVLKKAEEMLKSSQLFKSGQAVEKHEGAEPKGEIHPKEPQAGESEHPGDRVKEQIDPELNPKENAEGNNPLWGTEPTTYGKLKLAKFIGHMEAKRKLKKPGIV